jgi:hypothetical protein
MRPWPIGARLPAMSAQEQASAGSMLGRTLPAGAVAELAAGFGGQLVQPGNQNIRPSS